jgi:hypothetical protein
MIAKAPYFNLMAKSEIGTGKTDAYAIGSLLRVNVKDLHL